ncbi:MAG: hypothetical protein J6386_17500 [Candidatus Synoicihabitans palmerolidicus]|nr:hypothetical protein [Candidatus Synoicihabitans palmerolidicus]
MPYGEIPPPTDPSTPLPDPIPVHYSEAQGIPTYRDRAIVETLHGAPLFMTGEGLCRHDLATDTFHRERHQGPRFADGSLISHYMAPATDGGTWFEAKSARPSPSNAIKQLSKSVDGQWHPLALPYLSELGALDSLVSENFQGDEIHLALRAQRPHARQRYRLLRESFASSWSHPCSTT